MAVLVKIVHSSLAEGKDPRVEVQRRLLNYRNTPHSSTGQSPASLMMGRIIRTKIPQCIQAPDSAVHRKARAQDSKSRNDRKVYRDEVKKAREVDFKVKARVLLSQKKTTTKPPFDPNPFQVIKINGQQVTIQRGAKVLVRNKAQLKLLTERPDRLKRQPEVHIQQKLVDDAYDDDYEWYSPVKTAQQQDEDIQVTVVDNPVDAEGSEVVGEDITTEAEGLVAEEEGDRTEQLELAVAEPTEQVELAVAEPRSLSPRERKKRKAAARKRKDKDFIYY